jgi:hypothetical protein
MQRFILTWLLGLIVILGFVVGVNIIIDPYGIVGSPRIDGLNRYKVAAVDWPRVTKPYLITRTDPATLVMGSSPADVGLDPSSAAWPADRRPVFNMAIDGSSPRAQLSFEQHGLAATHPKLVVICLTLEDSLRFEDPALDDKTPRKEEFDDRMKATRSGAPNPDYAHGRFEDYLFAVASTRAFMDSLRTVAAQSDPSITYQSPQGYLHAAKFNVWAKTEGFHSLVTDKDERYVGIYLRWARVSYFNIEPLRAMIDAARDRGAQVVVAILPNYADQMEIRRQAGVTDRFDAWKTRVTELVAQANQADDKDKVTLWDFNGFNRYTTETLPPEGNHVDELQWFWEPVHFRPELGSILIERMMGKGPDDIGVVLTPENLAADIAAFHDAQDKWVAAHPADVARIARMIADSRCSTDPSTCGKDIATATVSTSAVETVGTPR